MSKCIKLGVFTFFAAFILFLICDKSYAIPREDFYDSNGKCIGSVLGTAKSGPVVVDYKAKLRQAEAARKKAAQKPPVKKAIPPKPPVKKSAPPKPQVDEAARMRKIAQEEIRKAEARQKAEAKKWDWGTATEVTAVGAGAGAIYGSIPTLGAGAGPGAVGGAVSGFLGYAGSWAYKNKDEFIEEYKQASKLEDPMGRWSP